MADNEIPSISALNRKVVVDLKKILEEFGESTNGLKKDLVARLHAVYLRRHEQNLQQQQSQVDQVQQFVPQYDEQQPQIDQLIDPNQLDELQQFSVQQFPQHAVMPQHSYVIDPVQQLMYNQQLIPQQQFLMQPQLVQLMGQQSAIIPPPQHLSHELQFVEQPQQLNQPLAFVEQQKPQLNQQMSYEGQQIPQQPEMAQPPLQFVDPPPQQQSELLLEQPPLAMPFVEQQSHQREPAVELIQPESNDQPDEPPQFDNQREAEEQPEHNQPAPIEQSHEQKQPVSPFVPSEQNLQSEELNQFENLQQHVQEPQLFNAVEDEQNNLSEASRMEEEDRIAEEMRIAEENRIAEQARLVEDARLAEESRLAEEKLMAALRLNEERRKADEIERRQLEEQQQAERQRLDDELKQAEQLKYEQQMLEFQNLVSEQIVAEEDEESEPEPDTSTAERNKENQSKKGKLTKAQKKKLKKKRSKENKSKAPNGPTAEDSAPVAGGAAAATDNDVVTDSEDVDIEYVPEEVSAEDSVLKQYTRVFAKFRTGVSGVPEEEAVRKLTPAEERKKMLERKKPVEMELKEDEEKDEPKISKKKLRLMTRMSVAGLKTAVTNAELVEMHDITAKDPLLLLAMKSTRNSVPVPRHWCYKRKYLQGKRGFEKPPFKLPEFIRKTGIQEMREAVAEKEDSKTLKTKMKEKMRPKMGKIDIDYQKLHDAFFKWQTKPKMTIHGDLYYEGKEFETRLKSKKPGELTSDLRSALGMPVGVNAHKVPPPWLIAMQRYGPPPSYPNLKIAGLNAPIPEGCSFGYHAGGWGKPPVDEYGRPLYGDVFGMVTNKTEPFEEEVDKSLWGELEEESEEEESAEEEQEEADEEGGAAPGGRAAGHAKDDASGFQTPMMEGLVTPSGLNSVPTGLETPGMIELRKRKIEAEMEGTDNRELFTVLSEKKNDRVRADMMASTHTYDLAVSRRKDTGGVDMAIDPSDLDMDPAEMNAKLEQNLREQGHLGLQKEDLSDMVADHVARTKKQKTGKETTAKDAAKSAKKYKDFKF